jgi:uncharacterized membrane protein (Fun14 family)
MQGIITSIKDWWSGLGITEWFTSSTDAVTVAVSFVSSFAVGFLFKKYLKFIFLCLVVSVLLIKGLEYYKILDVDWQALNTFLGLEPTETFSGITSKAFAWVKTHVIVSIASAVGFLIGYKLA